jgi:zinc transport system substrate-binding protein
VSVAPLGFFVERLAGDAVRLDVVLPRGANAHTFEPTWETAGALAGAALYVRVGHPGLPFERAALEALPAGAARPTVVDVAEGEDLHAQDPHLWLSPRRMRRFAERLAPPLEALLPAERDALAARRRALVAEIDALDGELAARLAPHRGRAIFVAHPAFGAFASDYGLSQEALERHHKEPDPRALLAVIEAARRAGARALVVQPGFPRDVAGLVAGEIGARVLTVDPLDGDWPATLRAVATAVEESYAP